MVLLIFRNQQDHFYTHPNCLTCKPPGTGEKAKQISLASWLSNYYQMAERNPESPVLPRLSGFDYLLPLAPVRSFLNRVAYGI